MGCDQIITGDFPDNSFDTVGMLKIAKFIESKIEEIQPEVIFTNFHGDLNIDHRITAEATLVAARPKPMSPVNSLYFYEVLSSTGWKFGSKQFEPTFLLTFLIQSHRRKQRYLNITPRWMHLLAHVLMKQLKH